MRVINGKLVKGETRRMLICIPFLTFDDLIEHTSKVPFTWNKSRISIQVTKIPE